MEILDVSRWQGNVDWKKVKASGKVDGVMLRTVSTSPVYGGIYIDPTFEKNYWGCVEAGLPVGAYYYTKATTALYAAQELAKLKVALEGKDFTMPIAVDVGDPSLKALGPEELANYAARQRKDGAEGFRKNGTDRAAPSGHLHHPSAADRGDGRFSF